VTFLRCGLPLAGLGYFLAQFGNHRIAHRPRRIQIARIERPPQVAPQRITQGSWYRDLDPPGLIALEKVFRVAHGFAARRCILASCRETTQFCTFNNFYKYFSRFLYPD
jgi:hypothetical protein